VHFGFVVPYADAREFAQIAALGEQHGWDGIFTWEAVFGVHAWVTLAAAAMTTERIRLGTLLTPAARWKPWDLASAAGTVDRLSGGRVIVSAGLGALHQGWTAFEADEGRKVRAAKLDECLAIYAGLLRGQPFGYEGTYYSAQPTDFLLPDPPVQRPHPPVWMVGAELRGRGDRQPSLDRAARWNGLLPQIIENGEGRHPQAPEELAGLLAQVRARREALGLGNAPYDAIVEADSTGEFITLNPADPAAWQAAGATWWIESWWSIPRGPDGLTEIRRRVRAGPPALS
jgi:alkanesulfonate monooxygenase SsuD/methylene tetrahydromethanopterin reductase-like flavin-dependent oxidoreductase (luciferase family)